MIQYNLFNDEDIDEFLKDFGNLFDEPAKKEQERKDYCYKCKSDELYWHAMTAKCCKCDDIILGG